MDDINNRKKHLRLAWVPERSTNGILTGDPLALFVGVTPIDEPDRRAFVVVDRNDVVHLASRLLHGSGYKVVEDKPDPAPEDTTTWSRRQEFLRRAVHSVDAWDIVRLLAGQSTDGLDTNDRLLVEEAREILEAEAREDEAEAAAVGHIGGE